MLKSAAPPTMCCEDETGDDEYDWPKRLAAPQVSFSVFVQAVRSNDVLAVAIDDRYTCSCACSPCSTSAQL